MSTKGKRPYRHIGLFLPHIPTPDDGKEWQYPQDKDSGEGRSHLERDGFILVQRFQRNVMLVQSLSTGQVVVMKSAEAPRGARQTPVQAIHPEFRTSTFQGSLNPLDPDPRATYFPKLLHWQQFPDRSFRFFFQYYNGGDLMGMLQAHHEKEVAVPEVFIWHLMGTLGRAYAFLHYGRTYDQGEDEAPADWKPIYHQDGYANNIFLHYPPKTGGKPRYGPEYHNALPQLVLGDMGMALVTGQDVVSPRTTSRTDDPADAVPPEAWLDVETMGHVLRQCVLAHVVVREKNGDDSDDGDDPSASPPPPPLPYEQQPVRAPWDFDFWQDDVRPCLEQTYTEQLLATVQRFNWPAVLRNAGARRPFPPPATMRWVCGELLTHVRAALDAVADGARACALATRDVSWTRPAQLMPWRPDHGSAAGARELYEVRRDLRREFGHGAPGCPAAEPVVLDYAVAEVVALLPAARGERRVSRAWLAERARLTEPVWHRDTWDLRAPPVVGEAVPRGFAAQAAHLLDALQLVFEYEAHRRKVDTPWVRGAPLPPVSPPSEEDEGVERETPLRNRRPRAYLDADGDHFEFPRNRLYRRLVRKLDALRDEVERYEGRRNTLRERVFEQNEEYADALAAVEEELSDHESSEDDQSEEEQEEEEESGDGHESNGSYGKDQSSELEGPEADVIDSYMSESPGLEVESNSSGFSAEVVNFDDSQQEEAEADGSEGQDNDEGLSIM